MKSVLKHQDLQMFCPKLKKLNNFHLFEVASRGGETQLQVGEHLT